jgi:hypothetical protein
MKRAILLAAIAMVAAMLSGCGHPNDITDEVAAAAMPAALA